MMQVPLKTSAGPQLQFFPDVAFRLQPWDGDAADEIAVAGNWRRVGWPAAWLCRLRAQHRASGTIRLKGTAQTIGARSG